MIAQTIFQKGRRGGPTRRTPPGNTGAATMNTIRRTDILIPIPQWDWDQPYPQERLEWLIDLCDALEDGDRSRWKRFYLTDSGFECLYPYGTGGQDVTAHLMNGRLINIIGPDLKPFDRLSRKLRGFRR